MTSISQIIPTYSTGGISDQPDELKKPGQVRDCVNAYPDLVYGLSKRPGLEYISGLEDECNDKPETTGGSWQHFVRQNPINGKQEKFFLHVDTAGKVSAYKADTGTAQLVKYYEKPSTALTIQETSASEFETCLGFDYLKADTDQLEFVSVNDFTYVTNPNVAVSMNPGKVRRWSNGDIIYDAFVEIKQVAYQRVYQFGVSFPDRDLDNASEERVTEVDIVEVKSFAGNLGNGSCPAQNRDTYTIGEDYLYKTDDNNQQDLILDIETTGRQVNGDDSQNLFCSYRHTVDVIYGGKNWEEGDRVKVYQIGGDEADPNGVADGIDPSYIIEITKVERINYSSQFPADFPMPSNGDQSVDIKDILEGLAADLAEVNGLQVSIVGNGIYMRAREPFVVDTNEPDLINVLSQTIEETPAPYVVVNNVSRLPLQCKNGIIAKVSNSFSDEDDYWVQFKTNYGETRNDNGIELSTGYWEEVAEPGGYTKFNSSSMPHGIFYRVTAREDDPSKYRAMFVVAPIKWNKRTVGTDELNPSFWNSNITNLQFYRNRLTFLSNDNVIMSKAGQVFDFFPNSAIAVAPEDPIDLAASTDYASVLENSIVINNGLVIFSKYQQYLLKTNNDILAPNTASIGEISRYEYNPASSNPVSVGTNIAFMGQSEDTSQFYEMTNIFNEGQIDVVDRSKIVSKSLPPGLNILADSKEAGLLVAGKRTSKDIWCYRYFKENSQSQLQAVWFRWQFPYPLVYHFIINSVYYGILNKDDEAILVRMDLDQDNTKGPFVDLWEKNVDDSGVPFTMRVDFPTINVVKSEMNAYRSDTTSSLVIHRMKFNFADIGSYYFDVNRRGMDNYDILYESRYMDEYEADETPVVAEVERTVPAYTRNTELTVKLKSDFPHPLVLYSMRWEGDYNQRYYKRV